MADAIVVLTGGRSRISTALQLLQNNHSKKLLISGVNPETSNSTIFHRFARHRSLFACCVDFDRRAKNTAQNARETSKWAKQNKYHSLIVVTSDYHLPRALLELSLVSPQTALYPVAAISNTHTQIAMLSDAEHLKIMLKEFAKTFIVSLFAIFPNTTD